MKFVNFDLFVRLSHENFDRDIDNMFMLTNLQIIKNPLTSEDGDFYKKVLDNFAAIHQEKSDKRKEGSLN